MTIQTKNMLNSLKDIFFETPLRRNSSQQRTVNQNNKIGENKRKRYVYVIAMVPESWYITLSYHPIKYITEISDYHHFHIWFILGQSVSFYCKILTDLICKQCWYGHCFSKYLYLELEYYILAIQVKSWLVTIWTMAATTALTSWIGVLLDSHLIFISCLPFTGYS